MSTEKTKPESPALSLLRATLRACKASDRRVGYALRDAVEAAIHGGLRFDPEDLVTATRHPRDGGLSLGSYTGREINEGLYGLAVGNRHLGAMTALERVLGRERCTVDGKVLRVGSQVRLGELVSKKNPGGWARVGSFSPDGKYVNFVAQAHEGERYSRPRCTTCRQEIREHLDFEGNTLRRWEAEQEAEESGPKRHRVTVAALREREVDRRAVLKMFFESPGEDPQLREFSGPLIVDSIRTAVGQVAKLKVGQEVTVRHDDGREAVLRRVAYLTHDGLAAARDGSYVSEEKYSRGTCVKEMEVLVRDGLVTAREATPYSHSYALTDAGKVRLELLTPESERERRRQKEREEAEAVARRQREQAEWAARQEREQAEWAVRREAQRADEEQARRDQQEAAELAAQDTPFDQARLSPAAGLGGLTESLTEEELDLKVTRRMARAAGNCATATDDWIASHAPGKTEITVRELLALDRNRNPDNVAAIVRYVVRKRRASAPVSPS